MVTYTLKTVPWNEQMNKSNFEKSLYGGFQEQAGPSKALIYQWKTCIKSFMALVKTQAEI